MAELTVLDEKLAEVLGLEQAAQAATQKVIGLVEDDEVKSTLEQMQQEAAETEQRATQVADGLEGKKTALLEKARETKGEATEMMKTYLGDEEEALDGFEFLAMAEAGELCHWEIVQAIAEKAGEAQAKELADWSVGVQRRHVAKVRDAYLDLAAEEAKEMASA